MSLQRNNGVDLTKYLSLEQTNSHLRQQLDSLDLLQQEHKLVEIQYREKDEACRELMNTLKYKSALCEDLESQLAKVIEKNTELTIANSDLQKKVLELNDVNEECQTLKTTLDKVETECVNAKTEVNSLTGKVRNLESVLDEMHRAAENRREIERQHREALENLKRKQDEVETTATKKQEDFINQLKHRIEDLEHEKRAQNERQ
jgi:chromosome segregation ATPase